MYMFFILIQTSFQNKLSCSLTFTRPIGLPPHAPVAQKIADQRWLIANSVKNRYLFFYIKWCDERLVSVSKHRFFLFNLSRSNKL